MPIDRISIPNIAIPDRSRGKEKVVESPGPTEPAPHIPLNAHVAPELQARAPRPYSTSARPVASPSKATDLNSPGLNRAHARIDLDAKFAAFSQRLKKEAAPAARPNPSTRDMPAAPQGESQKNLPKARVHAGSPPPAQTHVYTPPPVGYVVSSQSGRPISAASPAQTHFYTPPPVSVAVAYGYPSPYPVSAHYPNGPYAGPYRQPPYRQLPYHQPPYHQAPYYPAQYRQPARRNGVEAFFSKCANAVQNVVVVMLSGFTPRFYMQSLASQADRHQYQQQSGYATPHGGYAAPQANYYAPYGNYYQPHGYQAPR